ncbi:MAG: hypothetical protein NVSMB9_05870 [Isosphaeraceae bacterium]
MWKEHWRLLRDPFLAPDAPYVPTSGHDEIVARLADAIEARHRLVVLRAPRGMGKSVVLARALNEARKPSLRFARVVAPADGKNLYTTLARLLGRSVPEAAPRSLSWRVLEDAVRLCRFQGLHVVLVVEGCQELRDERDVQDLDRLTYLDANSVTRLTIIKSYHDPAVDDQLENLPDRLEPWGLSLRLPSLTQSETGRFVEEKLAFAGRVSLTFTVRAMNRLHQLSQGIPLAIQSLTTEALVTGAMQGRDLITSEFFESIGREYETHYLK